ncbi:MAG: class I SAM-dependent methyltransferase [Candidatus Saliniplasma sp.]
MKNEEYTKYNVDIREDIGDFVEKISDKIDEEFKSLPDKYHPADLGKESAILLYSLILEQKPETIVETGVCNGLSSSVILKALEDNDKGRLISIDLPAKAGSDDISEDRTGAVIPPYKESGWVVPNHLRSRWTLRIGDTFKETPKIFEKIGTTDMFIHDSDHSYEGMMFEFSLAWRHLKDNGFLLADNIGMSDAFDHFAKGKNLKKYWLGKMGLFKK